jgi:hypothetical protein
MVFYVAQHREYVLLLPSQKDDIVKHPNIPIYAMLSMC